MNGTKMSKREKDKVVRDAARAAGLDVERLGALAGLSDRRDADAPHSARSDGGLLQAWLAEQTQLPTAALARLARALHVAVPEIEIHDFRRSGYLPEVLVNFIALLGWNPGTPQERFTLDELCSAFSLERVGKTNAKFDREKLLAFNTAALEAGAPERKLAAFRDWLAVNEPGPLTGLDDATLAHLIELCRGFRTFADIELKCGALFVPDEAIEYDEKAVKQHLLKGEGQGVAVLRELRPRLAALSDWTAAALDAAVRAFADERQLGLGKVAQPLRVAVTGTTISPQISDTLALLGRERVLARIDRVLTRTGSPPAEAV